MEPNLHDWDMFIKPAELVAALGRAGLDNRDLQGIGPARNPVSDDPRHAQARTRRDVVRGVRHAQQDAREARPSLLYAGYAIKR